MRKTIRKKIGDKELIIQQMGARKAALLQVKIINTLTKNIKGLNLSDATDEQAAIELIAGVFSALDEKTADDLINRIIDGVSIIVDDTHQELSEVIDDVFAGNIIEMYKAIYAILEANYPDFLGEKGVVGKYITKLKTHMQDKTHALKK